MKEVIFHTIKWLLNCGADLNQSQSQKKWAQVFQKCDLRTSIQTLKLALTIISMATKKYKHFDLSSWIPYTSCTLCLRAFAHALLTAWNISCSPPSHDIPPISWLSPPHTFTQYYYNFFKETYKKHSAWLLYK